MNWTDKFVKITDTNNTLHYIDINTIDSIIVHKDYIELNIKGLEIIVDMPFEEFKKQVDTQLYTQTFNRKLEEL